MEKFHKLRNVLSLLVKTLRKQDFLVYFKKMSIVEIKNNVVVYGVVSNFIKDNVESKFYKDIKNATIKEFSHITDIEIIVDPNIDTPSNPDVIDCTNFLKEESKKITREKKIVKKEEKNNILIGNSGINTRYTLENFIVGGDNQLPYSACEAVSKDPGKSYNPLYIYGDVGLGKTHLLQGTGNVILKKFKNKKVLYTTADKFITQYVTSVKNRSVEKMREKYRDVDILIIDDVQFLAKKEQTQNELYNIFNLLYDNNKQIIISGDRPPKELENLEPRLRSRFEWGITVDIGKPDFETRLAILQEKSRAREFLIPHDVSEFIAANVTENVRELEGILNQIIAEYELDGMPPTLDRIARKLKKLSYTDDLLGNSKKVVKETKIKSYEDIIDAVSNHFGIEKEGILGQIRKKEFMIPRQVAMYLLKTKMNYTYERIGNIFSGRNHASVLYSCNKLESVLKKDKNLLFDINVLKDNMGL